MVVGKCGARRLLAPEASGILSMQFMTAWARFRSKPNPIAVVVLEPVRFLMTRSAEPRPLPRPMVASLRRSTTKLPGLPALQAIRAKRPAGVLLGAASAGAAP